MKGDFSRGFNPDRKRDRHYRRVLAQEGRLLLDSDLNALVDAQDTTLRRMADDFGCAKGSPDLGFLVTPGRLQRLFRSLDGVSAPAALDAYLDFSHKYLDRYPSLHLGNASGDAATATIELRAPTDAQLALWVRAEVATTVTVAGAALTTSSPTFERQVAAVPAGTTSIDVTLDDGEEIWIGLVEEDEDAGTAPRVWSAAGSYYADGLLVDQEGDGAWPDLHFEPHTEVVAGPPSGFELPDLEAGGAPLAAGDRVVVYLEAWERHLTAIEDPGVEEIALGGRQDTTTRSRALGQVKLAPTDGALTGAEIADAICDPLLPDGTLEVTTAVAAGPVDPCALPLQGGYTGTDNRLYRFEVHQGGALADTRIKWSRNNGSDLFRASDVTMNGAAVSRLVFPEETPLASGDLVEVLNEHLDLADRAPGELDSGAGTFTRPERSAGRLVRLQAVAGAPGAGRTFALAEPDDDSVAVELQGYGDPPDPLPKVRLWHGLFSPSGAADPHVQAIEDGIEVSLTGRFAAGSWWGYEARVGGASSSLQGPRPPDGPERLFAPLALLEYQGEDQPLLLLEWLDERFPSLCSISADDVSFDGGRFDLDQDTVQEIIEWLIEREGEGGCCDHTVRPGADGGDDADALRELLDDFPGDLDVCLKPGVYRFRSPIEVEDRRLTLRGCPEAVIEVATGSEAPFLVHPEASLRLVDLTLFAPADQSVAALVLLAPRALALLAERTGFLIAAPEDDQAAIRVGDFEAPEIDPDDPSAAISEVPSLAGAPILLLDECVAVAGWGVAAEAVGHVGLRGCALFGQRGGIAAAAVGRLEIDGSTIAGGLDLAETDEWTADWLLDEQDPLLFILEDPRIDLPGSAALLAGRIRSGRIADSRLEGGVSVAVRRLDDCRLSGNRHGAGRFGVALREAHDVELAHDELSIHESERSVGVHLVDRAVRVDVRDCRIGGPEVGPTTGVLLGAGLPSELVESPVYRTLEDVRVAGCRIAARETGIQAGGSLAGETAAGGGTTPFLLFRVRVRGNDVSAGLVAITIQTPISRPGSDRPRPGADRIACQILDNRTLGPYGIHVSGPGHEVASNQVTLAEAFGQVGSVAYAAYRTTGLVMEDNLADGRAEPQDEQAAGVAVYSIFEGSGARLTGNVSRVLRSPGSLFVMAHGAPRLDGNDFGSGRCEIRESDDPVIRSNRSDGPLEISDCRNGVLTENRIGGVRGDLTVDRMEGDWQIEDNKVLGTLRVRPSIHPISKPPDGPTDYYAFVERYGLHSTESSGSRALRELAGDAWPEVGDQPPGGHGRSMLDHLPGGAGNPGLLSTELEDWERDWVDAVTGALAGPFLEEAFPDREDGSVLTAALYQEHHYRLQAVGNWCQTLEIGHLQNESIRTSRETVVQAVANFVQDRMAIRRYERVVVTGNAADDYSPWIDHAAPVNTDNLSF